MNRKAAGREPWARCSMRYTKQAIYHKCMCIGCQCVGMCAHASFHILQCGCSYIKTQRKTHGQKKSPNWRWISKKSSSPVPAHGLGRWGGGLLSLLLSQSTGWAVACSPPLSQPTGWVGGVGALIACSCHIPQVVPRNVFKNNANVAVIALFTECSLGCCDRCTFRRA